MIACKYCIAEHGLRGSDLRSIDGSKKIAFETDGEFFDHLENEHDLIVQRENESPEEAKKRVYVKNRRIGTESCQCPQCKAERVLD